tara:strand:+ start:333 stop:1187 length:855 start_codon:yes stop_codon:yes gene_type:complete
MATINIGSLTFTHKGDYASGTTYAKNDVIYYSTNGNAYIAKQATTGNAPTSTAHWDVFAQGSGGIWNGALSLGSAGQSVKVNSAGNALEFGTIDSGKIKKTHWQWDNQQATIPQTSSGSGTGLDIFNYDFQTVSANPHFILDLSIFVGRDNNGNDQGDTYVAAWIHDTSGGTIRYPFGFYKSSGFRCNSNFRALTGNYLLEDTDAGQYSNTADWGGMRWSWPGVMGNQQSADTNPTAATIAAGSNVTLSIHIGGSDDTYYNRTKNQTNSTSRSWFKLTEISGTL